MTDRELLELAAKAAGLIVITDAKDRGLWMAGLEDEWNPLTDDGDALRMAVKLRMIIDPYAGLVGVPGNTNGTMRAMVPIINKGNMQEAMRRAIVTVAAKIGEQHGN